MASTTEIGHNKNMANYSTTYQILETIRLSITFRSMPSKP